MKTRQTWGQRGEWYVVIQIILFALIFLAPFRGGLAGLPTPWNLIGRGAGFLLILVGGVVAVAGVLSLGRNITAVPFPKDDAVLVEAGAFRYVRHPIYSGIILGAFGWGLLHNSVITLLLALFLFIFFDIKSRREEIWLREKYANYASYQTRVRKLIPLIY